MRRVFKFKPNSTLRRRNFIKIVKRIGIEIRFYTEYIKTNETYVASRKSDSYTRYLENTRKSYDLVVSQKNWNKLNTKRIRLSKALIKSRKNFL